MTSVVDLQKLRESVILKEAVLLHCEVTFFKVRTFYVFRFIKLSSFSGPSSHSEDLLVCENNSWRIVFCRKPLVCGNTFCFLRNCYFHFYEHALLSTNAWKLTVFSDYVLDYFFYIVIVEFSIVIWRYALFSTFIWYPLHFFIPFRFLLLLMKKTAVKKLLGIKRMNKKMNCEWQKMAH